MLRGNYDFSVPFNGVSAYDFRAPAIALAARPGWVGAAGKRFRPNERCTAAEAASIVNNMTWWCKQNGKAMPTDEINALLAYVTPK